MLYLDDEETFDHAKKEAFGEAHISVTANKMRYTIMIGSGWTSLVDALKEQRTIERIVVMGVDSAPTTISCKRDTLEFDFDKKTNVLIICKPNVSALENWVISMK